MSLCPQQRPSCDSAPVRCSRPCGVFTPQTGLTLQVKVCASGALLRSRVGSPALGGGREKGKPLSAGPGGWRCCRLGGP